MNPIIFMYICIGFGGIKFGHIYHGVKKNSIGLWTKVEVHMSLI